MVRRESILPFGNEPEVEKPVPSNVYLKQEEIDWLDEQVRLLRRSWKELSENKYGQPIKQRMTRSLLLQIVIETLKERNVGVEGIRSKRELKERLFTEESR